MDAQVAVFIWCFIGAVIGDRVKNKYKYMTGFIFGLISLFIFEVLK